MTVGNFIIIFELALFLENSKYDKEFCAMKLHMKCNVTCLTLSMLMTLILVPEENVCNKGGRKI